MAEEKKKLEKKGLWDTMRAGYRGKPVHGAKRGAKGPVAIPHSNMGIAVSRQNSNVISL